MRRKAVKSKNYRFQLPSFLPFLLVVALGLLAGCSTLKLDSSWRDRDITIDGKNDDWLGKMYYFEDDNVAVGFLNDETHFYACLIAEDRLIRTQVLSQGLTLWFDRTGGKNKVFGIKFPIGMEGRRGQEAPMDIRERESVRERMREAMAQSLKELEILGQEKGTARRIQVEEATGIEIALRPLTEMLVYEVKLPLFHGGDHPFAIGAKPGDIIGVGLEVPKLDMRELGERRVARPGGRMPGGGPGGIGGRGPRMGMPGGQFRLPKGLKIWAAVTLAPPSAQMQD